MSMKPQAFAGNSERGSEAQARLKEAGVNTQQAQVARDLGLDASLAWRRPRTTQRIRKGWA
eukprot:5606114-Pyramimonas_sp.AAC.1